MTTHNLPLINRFKSRVVFHSPDDKNGCDLIPDDKLSGDEYGRIRVDGRLERLHRVAYTLFIGPIPQGMCVCHTCDTRNCVRPEHLFLDDRDGNNRDRSAKGRSAVGERSGKAKLTEEDATLIIEMYANGDGGWSHRQLAAIFCVSHNQIGEICRGEQWRHLDNPTSSRG